MNYGEIKKDLTSLGFADTDDYKEYEELGYTHTAINLAVSTIGTLFPYVNKYELVLDDSVSGIISINMNDLVTDFLGFASVPVKVETSDGSKVYEKFSDYELDADGSTIWLDATDNKGKYYIHYNCRCTQVDENTEDDFEFELPLKCHHLIPLLSAFYLWQDDDQTKAVYYNNQYESELQNLMAKQNAPRMRVVTEWGVSWL